MNFPTVNSASEFMQSVLDWKNSEGVFAAPPFEEVEVAGDFLEQMAIASEQWLSFSEWETFCMDNDLC